MEENPYKPPDNAEHPESAGRGGMGAVLYGLASNAVAALIACAYLIMPVKPGERLHDTLILYVLAIGFMLILKGLPLAVAAIRHGRWLSGLASMLLLFVPLVTYWLIAHMICRARGIILTAD